MLLLLVLAACGGSSPDPVEPSKAAKPERKHHVERSDRSPPADGNEDVAQVPAGSPADRAPIVRAIHMKPARPSRLDTLTVDVNVSDPEGEELTIEYHWSVDGNEAFGHDEPRFDLRDYERGQKVQLTVRIRDLSNEVHGTSDIVTIDNADPQFTVSPEDVHRFDGFRIEAEDPDGDAITMRLDGGPAGATLDPRGVLHFKGSEADKGGHYAIKVILDDGHGGKGTMELPLDVSPGSGAKPLPPGVPTGSP